MHKDTFMLPHPGIEFVCKSPRSRLAQKSPAMSMPSYLHAELSGEEDPGLTMPKTHMDAPDEKYKIPPGIKTLHQWGEQKFPSGKHQGKTFFQVFQEDDGYLMQVKNRKAVSTWMRSFQNYIRAMWLQRSRQQRMSKPESINLTMGYQVKNPSRGVPSSSQSSQNHDKDSEWEKVSSLKRQSAEKEPNKHQSTIMHTEANREKVEKLQTQIAILQRELAIETQVPEDQ